MAANDVILARIPVQNGEITVKNTDGTNALVPGNTVVADAANPVSGTQGAIGAKRATADDVPLGLVLENIAVGAYGRVAVPFTSIAVAIASGAVTANTYVECDTAGTVKTCVAAKAALGVALTAAAGANDQILVGMPGGARNA